MAKPEKPLVNDTVLRERLTRLETEGTDLPPVESEAVLPPVSATRPAQCAPVQPEERMRLRSILRMHRLDLINDGSVFRVKTPHFEYYTLKTSPLIPEERGGDEGYALIEAVMRFCGTTTSKEKTT